MKKLLLSLCCIVVLASSALCQSDSEKAAFESNFGYRVVQLELYNKLLPVLFTKDQLKKILPAIEKARAKVRETKLLEYTEMKKLDAKLSAALKDAQEKNLIPAPSLLSELLQANGRFNTLESAVATSNTEDVFDVLKANLNTGQIKAAGNAVPAAVMDPKTKPEDLDTDAKLRVFVRQILLHPAAYDLLVKMSK